MTNFRKKLLCSYTTVVSSDSAVVPQSPCTAPGAWPPLPQHSPLPSHPFPTSSGFPQAPGSDVAPPDSLPLSGARFALISAFSQRAHCCGRERGLLVESVRLPQPRAGAASVGARKGKLKFFFLNLPGGNLPGFLPC